MTSVEQFLQGGSFTIEPVAKVQKSISAEEFFAAGSPDQDPPAPPFSGDPGTEATSLPPTRVEAPEGERPGFISRVTTDLKKRAAMFDEIQRATESDEQTLPEGILQAVGKVGAGSILDIIGEGVSSGVEFLSDITPDEIEDPVVNAVVSAGTEFLETDLGKAGLEAAQKGLEAWNEFRAGNPRAARNIEATVDIALLVSPVKGKPKVKARPTFAEKLATKIDNAATVQSARQRADFVDDLIRPKKTKAVREEEVARSVESGLLRSRRVELTPAEKAIADEVSKIEGVKSSRTLLGNFNAIKEANRAEAQSLTQLLKQNEVIIPKREFVGELDRAVLRLAENPLIVGDAAKTATRVVDKMKQIVEKNPGTASGLLKSRKELDAFIASQKPKVFDPAQESALSIAVREIRQSTNDFIDARATNVAVKESLSRQSSLFKAMENIGPKAADEAGNAALRLFQRAAQKIDIGRTLTEQISRSLLFLAGGGALLSSAHTVAPFITGAVGAGAITVAGGRMIASPAAKRALASLLRVSDKAIKVTKDPVERAQLLAARGAVFEISEQLSEAQEQSQ